MPEIRTIKSADLFPLVLEIVEYGRSARIKVKGSSMYPFLRDSIDSVELSKGSFDAISRGVIVLIQRIDGTYVMHRVIKKRKESFYIVGDAQDWIEGPLQPSQVKAVVTAIWRADKRIDCSNMRWRLLSGLWLDLRPIRHLLLNAVTKFLTLKQPKSICNRGNN